jgi:hypothetical protein
LKELKMDSNATIDRLAIRDRIKNRASMQRPVAIPHPSSVSLASTEHARAAIPGAQAFK